MATKKSIIKSIYDDIKNHPRLFKLQGSIPREKVENFLSKRGIHLPADLVEFYTQTGGGDLFESETILPLTNSTDNFDSLSSMNQYHHKHGLKKHLTIFHIGTFLTAIDQEGKDYIVLRNDYKIIKKYGSFAKWYEGTIRGEFSKLYNID